MTLQGDLSPRPYAVVVGLELNGLGVVRALGMAGVPVIAIDTNLRKPTAATRFGRKIVVRALSGPEFVDDLLALRQQFTSDPVLVLTQEASVATVSAARDLLSAGYRFTMPATTLMDELLDKLRFQALAERHCHPIPRAIRLGNEVSGEVLRLLRYPCVVKPARRSSDYDAKFKKAYKVTAPDEVMRLWSEMRAIVGEVIVQEWIEGEDSDVYFCLQYRSSRGGPSTSFVGRKTTQWPVLVGGTACCVPAPEASVQLTRLTDEFFSAVGFVGIGSIEYKRDRRDGVFYMVEPTVGRTDYQEEIATLNGVNIPLALYRDAVGLPRVEPKVGGKQPCAWRDRFGYLNAVQAGAFEFTGDLFPNVKICDAVWRVSDPMPFIKLKVNGLFHRLSRFYSG